MFTCIQDFLSQNIKIYVYIYIYIYLSLSLSLALKSFFSLSLCLSLSLFNARELPCYRIHFQNSGEKKKLVSTTNIEHSQKKKKNYNYRRFNAIHYTHVIRHNQWRKGVLLLLAPELGFDPIWFLYTLFFSKYLLPLHK